MELFNRIFSKLIYCIMLSVSAILLVRFVFVNHLIIREGLVVTQHMILIGVLIGLIVLFYVISKFKNQLTQRSLFKGGLIICSGLGILFLFLTYPNSEDDAAIILSLANRFYEQFINGDFSLRVFECAYLSVHPFQFGILLVEFLINIITFGNAALVMPILNLFAVLGVYYFGSRLLNLKASRFVANVYVILFCLNFVPFVFSKYVYGWQIGMFLAMASLFYFVQVFEHSRYDVRKLIISFALLVAGCFIKSNFSILAVAYLLVILINLGTLASVRRKIAVVIASVAAMILCLNLSTYVYSFSIGRYETGVPKIMYLAMGQQEGPLGNGWYNGYNGKYLYEFDQDKQIATTDSINSLKERVSQFVRDPGYAVNFYIDKFESTFLVSDFQSHAYFNGESNNQLNHLFETGCLRNITYYFNNIYFALFWIGICVSCFYLLKERHNGFDYRFVILLGLCGVGGYHMLFETKAIYVFPWVVIGSVVAAQGIADFSNRIDEIKSKTLNGLKLLIISGFLVSMGVSLAYNWRTIYILQCENYTDDVRDFLMTQGNYISFEYTSENNYVLSDIELLTNGIIPETGTFAIEIQDDNGTVMSLNYYDFANIGFTETWLRFAVQPVELVSGEKYVIRLYTNIVAAPNSDNFSIVVGDYVQFPSLSVCELNGYVQGFYVNAKFYGQSKGFETIDYLYSQPSLEKRISSTQNQ